MFSDVQMEILRYSVMRVIVLLNYCYVGTVSLFALLRSQFTNAHGEPLVFCVADPRSGAFLTPGSGIRNRFFPDPDL